MLRRMHTLIKVCGGYCAGVVTFFIVIAGTGTLYERLLNYSLTGDIVLFLIAAAAAAYICA
jgi:hypothetical protein